MVEIYLIVYIKIDLEEEELKKLFLMPKSINWENLAKGYQVPIKNVSDFNKLREAFEWSLSMQKSVIIKVDINVKNEMIERNLIFKKILHKLMNLLYSNYLNL